MGRRVISDKKKYRITSVYLNAEKVDLLKALGYNLSELVDEVLDYAVIGRLDDLKQHLQMEIEEKIESRKKETRKTLPLKEIANKPIY